MDYPHWVGHFRHQAAENPDKTAITFLANGETETGVLTYAQLECRARAVAAHLQAAGASGERVALLLPSGLDYVAAFLGCLFAGAIAVPIYPPRVNRNHERIDAIVNDAKPELALTSTAVYERVEPALASSPLGSLAWLTVDDLPDRAGAWREPVLSGETPAFLQYTSGSTSAPKGVEISHANLLANHRMVAAAFEQTPQFCVVSWLPLFHDMGLIGNLLQALFAGNHLVLMPPEAFLIKPVRWLRAISRYKAQAGGGPNFAYDLCVKKVTPEQRAELSLDSWELAFCGAEPVRGQSLQKFAATFKSCGFQNVAFYPCYGLAEATLFVAGGAKATAPPISNFDISALEQDRAEPATENARTLVGCGHAWPPTEIIIVAPDSHIPLPAAQVGEIWVRGPQVAVGYWNRPDETEEHFGAHLPDGSGPFLRTGDVGFFHEGELFLTGRLKDLIIIAGRNHHPADIEATVEACHKALRPGGCAAFAIESENGEILAVVAEVQRTHLASIDTECVVGAIRQAIAQSHDLRAHSIHLIPPASLPKTSSGKLQRHVCRNELLAGILTEIPSQVH